MPRCLYKFFNNVSKMLKKYLTIALDCSIMDDTFTKEKTKWQVKI